MKEPYLTIQSRIVYSCLLKYRPPSWEDNLYRAYIAEGGYLHLLLHYLSLSKGEIHSLPFGFTKSLTSLVHQLRANLIKITLPWTLKSRRGK